MSQLTVINYPQLEEFLQKDGPTEEEVKAWYDRLAEYEIEGSETAPEIELLYNGARYLMGFGFTAAEELRDVAEQEAVTMAEKEDQWEEQKAALNLEIDSLRDRITSKADVGDSTEAFRAQIDSLKEENRQLQQSNRDRDREMADQRDRFEMLASRVDTLTRERDALSDHKTQLEDTIRELNRRLSAKTEDTGADWESKKLKLRNEQVLTISRQMQAVVAQNEELREEIDRVSDALEEATRIIEQSARRYTEMTNSLEVSQLRVEELYQQNRRLTQMLPEELMDHVNRCISSAEAVMSGSASDKVNFLMDVADLLGKKFMNDDEWILVNREMGMVEAEEQRHEIQKGREKITELQRELQVLTEELGRAKLKISEDRTGEREQELEQLKKELIDATTLARNLFGEAMSDVPGQDPTTTLQMRILQLEHSLETLLEEKEKMKKVMEEMEFTIEQKDESNASVLTELNRIKDTKFGSSREEMTKLEKQLHFRDEQIGKLQQHCTLLQIELGRYAEGTYQPVVKPRIPRVIKRTDKLLLQKNEEKPDEKKAEVKEKETTKKEPLKPTPRVIEDVPTASESEARREPSGDYSDVAQQAVLISNLYYEMMQLLEEISYKDEKLVEMQKSWKSTQRSYQEMKAQLEMAYEEIRKLKKENMTIEERMVNEFKDTESVELRRLVESINMDGNEMERRMGEATRMLVTERIERMRYTRQCTILKTKSERLEDATRRTREQMRERELHDQRAITRLKYELDVATIEVGKLQTRILQSVPTDDYDKLMRKYKRIVKESSGVETNNEELPRQEMVAFSKNPSEAETEARENMLKKMIDVVSDQSDFWNQEAAMLQAENEELKKFIEDVENESDLKSVLGAVERRLLATIRELRENEREFLREKKRQRGADGEMARDSERLRGERMAILSVVNVLQRENKLLRDQAIGTVSLQQLEVFRGNIFEAQRKEAELATKMESIEKMKDEAETEMLRIRALRTANEMISSFDGREIQNNEMTERQIQQALFNCSQQSAKAKQFERMVHLKEQRVAELNEEMRELRQWNLELIATLEGLKDFRGRRESVRRQESVRPNEVPVLELSPDKESDYEMDYRSETSSSESTSERVVVRTIVQDNVDAFENRIKEIKASAQLAVQGYKEQLELKEIAIERYKKMLSEKIDEGVQIIEKVEIVHQEVEVQDKETEKRLEESEGRVRELEREVKEIKAKLKKAQKVGGAEKGSGRVVESGRTEERRDMEVQTDVELTPRSPHSPASSRRHLNNSNEDHELPQKSERVKRLEEEMQLMQELVAKSDSKDGENLRQKSEIRDLKARIQRLTKTNKELMVTCEQIKEDALAELSTFRRNNENSDERRMADLRIDLERLRGVNRTLKLANEELKSELEKVKQLVDKKNNKNEPDEWERRKSQEKLITTLRDRLKKKETIEKEYLEKLEKRDRLVETMRNDQGLRSAEIDRLQRRIKASDPAAIKSQSDKEWSAKVAILEANITRKSEELTLATRNITRIRNELESIKTRHTREIEKIQVEQKEVLVKEVRKAREDTKRAMTVIRPALYSREVQTDEVRKMSSSSSSTSSESAKASPPKSSSRTVVVSGRDRRDQREIEIVERSPPKSPNSPKSPKSDRSDYHRLRENLQLTQDRLIESQEKLIKMERDYTSLYEKFDRLRLRSEREEKPTGAVLVLSDKLAAKDREIAQLKQQIAHLQRTISLPYSL